ncbi:MAG: hypothetical protein ABJF01_24385 [bacterium]
MKTLNKLLVIAGAVGCGGDGPCIVPPCAFPAAFTVAIKSATGLPLNGFVRETDEAGAVLRTTDCSFDGCIVGQGPGTYHLVIGREGFASKQMTLIVNGREGGRCSCTTAETQHLEVTLVFVPTSSVGISTRGANIQATSEESEAIR